MSFMGRPANRRNYGKTRAVVGTIAQERIEILIGQARQMVGQDETLARRYVDLARRISERTKVRIPSEFKRYLCKSCGIALVPGKNTRVRLYSQKSGIVITCLTCGAVKRYPVNPKTASLAAGSAIKPYIVQSGSFPKKNSSKD